MVCICGHSGFHHAGLEGYCMLDGCGCDSYYEEVKPSDEENEEDDIAEYDWEVEHNAEEE